MAHENVSQAFAVIDFPGHEDLWIAPNPASDYLNIYFKSRPSGKVTITLYTLMGERVKTLQVQEDDPSMLVKEDVSSLQSGTYLVRIEDNGTVLKTMRFVKR